MFAAAHKYQIDERGIQVHEKDRTMPVTYSIMNGEGVFVMGHMIDNTSL